MERKPDWLPRLSLSKFIVIGGIFMQYLNAFLCGGLLCALGQLSH